MLSDLPASEVYLDNFKKEVFGPSKRKESGTVFFLPGMGRNSLTRYLAHFGKNEGVVLTVDSDEEESIVALWKAMLAEQSVMSKATDSGGIILEITGLGKRVLLCAKVGEDGPSVGRLSRYRNLQSTMVDFSFGVCGEREMEDIAKDLGELGRFALQNCWVMPVFDGVSIERVIQNQVSDGFASKVSDEQKNKIRNLSGGYVSLARFLLRHLELLDEEVQENPEVKFFFDGIWNSLADESRLWLLDFVGGKLLAERDFLAKTGLVVKGKLFSEVFEKYVKGLAKQVVPVVKEVGGVLMVGNIRAEVLLTIQEMKVLKVLLGGEIISREKVADVLWGVESEDKYSDWAINQVIRRIRVKIGDVREDKKLIETIRGKGFVIKNG